MSDRTCSIDGCESPAKTRGWCSRHYQRWWKYGDPLRYHRQLARCSILGCDRPVHGNGWCLMHYKRWRKHGDPERVPMGSRTLIERTMLRIEVAENGCWLFTGCIGGGYGRIGEGGGTRRVLLAHRVTYEHFVGPIPEGLELDHLCHTQSDCTLGADCPHRRCVNPAHLEPVTTQENTARANRASRKASTSAAP